MVHRPHVLRVATALALAPLLWPAPAARPPAPPAGSLAGQQLDLESFPEVDLASLSPRHREWIQKDVVWIITPREREVFVRLEDEGRRDRFIEEFWRNRDPSPGTEANEYRDLHYERLAYAGRIYGRETPREGWETDRGRIYILLGKPQSVNRLPNTQEAVPVEVWFYAVDPALGVPAFFYLIFFKDSGVGEYRLYSPSIDGPTKLLNVSGQLAVQRGEGGFGPVGGGVAGDDNSRAVEMLRRVDPELANAAASLIPGEGGTFGVSPLRSEMVISRVFDLPNRLMPDATWAYNVLTGVTESRVRFETLPLEAQAVVLRDREGNPFLHYVTRTAGDRLNLNNYQERYYVTFQVSTTIRDEQLRFLDTGEPRTLQADLDAERARTLRFGDVQFMDRIPLVPGRFTLDLVLENNVTGEFGRLELPVDAAGDGASSFPVSGPILVLESQDLGARWDPFAEQYPFQVGSRALVPAFEGPFPRDGALQVFWQMVLGPAADPLLSFYRVLDAQGTVRATAGARVDTAGRSAAGVLDHLDEIDLAGLPAGRYRLVADLDDDGRDPTTLPFEIVESEGYRGPFVHALRKPPGGAPAVTLERARQLRTLGRTTEAIAELDEVLRREPGLEDALRLQVELLTDAGQFARLVEILEPRLARDPNDGELLLAVADASARLGQHYDAIRYYERARLGGAAETTELLNALASEYYAEGNLERTRELLGRSLELDPEQPQMRRLLQELLAR